MKIAALALVALSAHALAQPHRHGHRHALRSVEKREPAVATAYVPGPVATVVVYELDGHPITEAEVRQGIANGTLIWGADGSLSSSIDAHAAQATPPPQEPEHQAQPSSEKFPPPAPSSSAIQMSALPVVETTATPIQTAQPQPEPQSSAPASYHPVNQDGGCADCDKPFPNGTYDCSDFPTGYGAVRLQNEGLGGWSGIQDPQNRGAAGYDDIMTVPTGSCDDGSCCTPGRFCSYACPNPYLKQSFPAMQGATGQSVGGLYCNNDGKLEMADGSIGDTLCGRGTDKFTVKVVNKLSKSVSICRTDYPGTEAETIPFTLAPGKTGELATPDQSKYYFWKGQSTSAQYYINKQGVPENEACTWGTGAQAVGNWAPAIFGTSWDDINMHAGFPSLFQNRPTTEERLDFNIEFSGEGVTNLCSYKKTSGEYCSEDKCSRDDGCTASVKEGATLTVTFSDN